MYYFTHPKLTFSERLFSVAVLAVTLQLSFPQYSHAAVAIAPNETVDVTNVFAIEIARTGSMVFDAPPIPLVFANEDAVRAPLKRSVRRAMWVMVTAYSSAPEETDGSPYITARNTFVRDGVVAANFLPFGTILRMPENFGDKEFVVEDRMNARYFERIDIWMPNKAEAKQWGARWVKIEVL